MHKEEKILRNSKFAVFQDDHQAVNQTTPIFNRVQAIPPLHLVWWFGWHPLSCSENIFGRKNIISIWLWYYWCQNNMLATQTHCLVIYFLKVLFTGRFFMQQLFIGVHAYFSLYCPAGWLTLAQTLFRLDLCRRSRKKFKLAIHVSGLWYI